MEDEYCPSSAEDEGPEESDSDEDYTSISEGGSESGILVVLAWLHFWRDLCLVQLCANYRLVSITLSPYLFSR